MSEVVLWTDQIRGKTYGAAPCVVHFGGGVRIDAWAVCCDEERWVSTEEDVILWLVRHGLSEHEAQDLLLESQRRHDDRYTCDGCGQDVPVSEIAAVIVQGVEGDFCERCRGIPAEQDPADHHLEQLNEMRLERERDEDEWDRLNFEAEIEETERELGTGR